MAFQVKLYVHKAAAGGEVDQHFRDRLSTDCFDGVSIRRKLATMRFGQGLPFGFRLRIRFVIDEDPTVRHFKSKIDPATLQLSVRQYPRNRQLGMDLRTWVLSRCPICQPLAKIGDIRGVCKHRRVLRQDCSNPVSAYAWSRKEHCQAMVQRRPQLFHVSRSTYIEPDLEIVPHRCCRH